MATGLQPVANSTVTLWNCCSGSVLDLLDFHYRQVLQVAGRGDHKLEFVAALAPHRRLRCSRTLPATSVPGRGKAQRRVSRPTNGCWCSARPEALSEARDGARSVLAPSGGFRFRAV